jgi:serine/threonine protein kinase
MTIESNIFDDVGQIDRAKEGFYDFKLLKTTTYATLYIAFKSGKRFLVKTPKDKSEWQERLLRREFELALDVEHPNIVHLYTLEHIAPYGVAIVMEYVDGRTLEQFLAENPTPSMRCRAFEQLLQAVAYIHRRGLVHNDIKPENILITRTDNDVKLIDFGLSDSDAYYLARTIGCTKAYASPELLARDKEIDARSDIYSLGVVMKDIFGNRYSRISSRCLNSQKEKRYANAEDLLSAFKHRNTPLKLSIAILPAIFLMLPLVGYVVTSLTERRQVAERDAIIVQVEKDVEEFYQIAVDSIADAVYFEFACNNIVSFYEKIGEYQKEKISPITDPELSTIVSASYMNKLNACQEKLWQSANVLPSFCHSGLSVNEVLYYDSLVSHRLPYVPYE